MGPTALVVAVLAGAALLGLAVSTGAGSRRRGSPGWRVVLEGVLFPVAWVVWYFEDEVPRPRRS